MSLRQEKIEELLRRLAATFFEIEGNRDAMISVTHVEVTPDAKRAKIFLSIFPENKEVGVFDFAKRKRGDLREYIKEHLKMKVIPFVDVEIDRGEKARQKIDQLLRE